MNARLHVIAGIITLLGLGFVLGAGCGGDQYQTPAADNNVWYSLDPPELGVTDTAGFESGVPVLCYHYFRAGFDAVYFLKVLGSVILGMPALGPREFWTTPVGEFEKHLRYLRDSGTRVMTLDDVADFVDADRPLPTRAVVLTIDDADESVYRLAWPLLKKYNLKAHLFVPTAQVGSEWSDLQICTWDQLREMSDSGHIIVGSHTRALHFKVKTAKGLEPVFWHPERVPTAVRTRNMVDLARQLRQSRPLAAAGAIDAALAGPWGPVVADLLASRFDIAAALAREPRWLAWPYGFAHGELDSIGQLVGFRGTVSLEASAFAEDDTLLAPGRYTLTAKTTLAMIEDVLTAQ